MTEHDALLAAVLADPADDLPRLLYADWRDDRGDADRAEFIRVQVAAAWLPTNDPRRLPLDARAKELEVAHSKAWKVSGVRGGQKFERGFVTAWSASAEWFLTGAYRMFAAAPVTAVRLRVMVDWVSLICRVNQLARVEHLDLSGNLLAAGNQLEKLLTVAPLDQLRSLAVGYIVLFADGLSQIGGSPVAGRLIALDLSGNPLADEGLTTLAGITRFARLESLTLRCNELTFEDSVHSSGALALADTANFPKLTHLDLAGHRIGTSGAAALIAGRLGRQLDTLNLSNNDLGTDDEGWAEGMVAGSVRRLRAGGRRNRIGSPDAAALRRWLVADAERTLDLRGAEVTTTARDTLAQPDVAARVRIDPEAS